MAGLVPSGKILEKSRSVPWVSCVEVPTDEEDSAGNETLALQYHYLISGPNARNKHYVGDQEELEGNVAHGPDG